MRLRSARLTGDGLAVSQTHYLPVQDAAPSAEGFEELLLLLVDDVLYHFWVFLQLWERFTLEDEREEREAMRNVAEVNVRCIESVI